MILLRRRLGLWSCVITALSLSLVVNAQPNIAVIIVPIIFAIIIAGIIGAAYVLVKKR